MTHIHYKFSSKLSYDTVVFDGPYVTLRDLKRQIMVRERLRAGDCDLQITSSENKEEYTDDECLIPRGSSVIVRRIPVVGARPGSSSKTRNIERTDVHPHHAFGGFKAMNDQNSSSALPFFTKMANLADVDVSEEDKIKAVIHQSNYDSMNYNKKFDAVLPANYTCFRCGNTGHHIKNCPNSGQDKNFEAPLRIKKSTGIPRSFMVEVDSPNIKGAMLTNCGRYAIPSIDIEAYAIGKKEKPPFIPQEERHSQDKEDPVPEELLCLICHELLSDAVLIPCCRKSYCDDCIRTALLDSEEHVCPTCNQSDVSPDTLISNTFLRQAVDNFQNERVTKTVGRGCATTQSQNPTPRPSPVFTPPLLTMKRQPQLSTQSQQDPLLYGSQAADTPPSSQVCRAPPTATGLTSAPSMPSTSLQPVQTLLEIPDNDLHTAAEEKTHHDSATAATQSVKVSSKGTSDAPSHLSPLVELTPEVRQLQTVSADLQQPSSDPAPGPSSLSTCWDSSSSSSGCRTKGLNESTIQPPSISSYPATPPPLFPSPHFHSFLTAQQPLSSYPPGYPPPTPVWTIPNLQGAPIPSLCPSTPIPALIPKEWYMHKRSMKERSPHRGSSHRPSSHSNSKSSKSKSSRSYSPSSSRSRSRSRSRSKGRSRPRSPYSRHRDHRTRSRSSLSYSYGYKRSPTPSSSSSPQVGYHSRSPSVHHKNSHHSRHHRNKSASSSYSSRRREEDYPREVGGSGGSSASHLYAQHTNQSSSLESHEERYLQWKREYKEWYDKYFSSYVGHFHQLPIPLLSLPPPPPLHWGDREGSKNHSHDDSRNRLKGRHSSQMGDRSPPSQSSSDSRSPPSQSSCDSRSTPSKSSSDSRSSPSHLSNDSQSPPSQSSSDGRSTPSEDGTYHQRDTEKYSRLPITPSKTSKEVEHQEKRKNDKHQATKTLEDPSYLKHEQKSMKEHEEGRGEAPSCPEAVDSTRYCRNDKRWHSTGQDTCKDGTPSQDKATANNAFESVQLAKSDKRLDKDYGGKSRERRHFEIEKGERRGKHSDSRQEWCRRHKEKPSKASDREDTHRYPAGSRASDSKSEENRKRKGEDIKSNSGKSKCLKTNTAEDSKTHRSESLNTFDRNKPKTEKKMERPMTERVIWEGGMKVKPQKKISININLEGKRMEDKQNVSYLESIPGKTNEETEKASNKEEETGGAKNDVNEKKESSRDQEDVSDEKIKADEGETRQKQEETTITNDKGDMLMEVAGQKNNFGDKKEDGEEEDVDLWLSALRSVEEEENKKPKDDRAVRMQVSTEEEVLNVKGGKEGQTVGELVADMQKNSINLLKPEEELMEGVKRRVRSGRNQSHHDLKNTAEDDDSYEERRAMRKTLEEFTQDRPAEQKDTLLMQVPLSKWEKEEEKEPDEATIKVQRDALETFLPTPSVSETAETTASRKTETEEKRERSDRRVSPSSGKSRTASTLCTDGKKSMEKERDRERERLRDEQKEKRLKQRTREEEKRGDREKVRGHSSNASNQKRNPSSSSQSSSRSTSHDIKMRRDDCSKSSCLPGGKSTAGRSRESGATGSDNDLPNRHVHKSHRDAILDLIFKDKIHPHSYYNHYRYAESCHSPPSRAKDRDPLASWTELGQPRASSPALEVMQSSNKNMNEVKTDERKLTAIIKENKRERKNQDMVAERGGRGSRWEEEADELDGQTKWEGRRKLVEGEKPTSSSNSTSSSASQERREDEETNNPRNGEETNHCGAAGGRRDEETQAQQEEKQRWEGRGGQQVQRGGRS